MLDKPNQFLVAALFGGLALSFSTGLSDSFAGNKRGFGAKRDKATATQDSSAGTRGLFGRKRAERENGKKASELRAAAAVHPLSVPASEVVPPGVSPVMIEDLKEVHGAAASYASAKSSDETMHKSLSLEQCIEIAMTESSRPKVGRASKLIAEAQHRQALAAYWPHVSMTGFAQLRSNEPNFEFPGLAIDTPATQFTTPEMQFNYPGGTIKTPATAIQVPAHALYPGSPALAVPVASQNVKVPGQTISVPSQTLDVPSQHIVVDKQTFDLADRFTYGAALDAKWLIADGGERRSRRKQALSGIEAAHQEERADTIDLVSDVKRYYQGAVLARQLLEVANDVHERMKSTLDLTKTFFEGGSMEVTKMDYLRNKVMVDALESGIAKMEANYELACSALTHSMGLGWQSRIEPLEQKMRYEKMDVDLGQMIGQSYQFHPDWKRLLAGLEAAEFGVKKQRAGFSPKVAFLGKIHAIENNHESGVATDENLNAWTVGIGVEVPIFHGFLTKNRVAEAKARLEKMEHQQVLLEEGLAMMVKKSFIDLAAAQKREKAMQAACSTAAENRELTDRAYRAGMAEADEIFRALVVDALSRATQLKTQYDAVTARIELDAAVGTGFTNLLANELTK